VTIARSPRSSVAKRPFGDIFRRITPISLNIAPPTVDIQTGFPYIIKDENKYVRWSEQMLRTASNQEVDEILDTRPIPLRAVPFPGTDEYIYYQDMNKYIFSVLDSVVKTRKGLEIIRDYAATTDGCKASKEVLHAYYTTSLHAQHRLANQLTKITSARLSTQTHTT
jgi:hypothetical protein